MPYSCPRVGKDWPVTKTRQRRPATLEEAFGQVLFEHRERNGLSQMDLAVASGYSLRYVGDVERGTKSPTLRTMNDLATLLNLSVGALVVAAEESLFASRKSRRGPVSNRARKPSIR